jgi:hypothetical protein
MTQSTMIIISIGRYARRPIKMRNWHGKRLGLNIETIHTPNRKEHCLGDETNKAFAFCKYMMTESSPWKRFWKEPWSYVLQELDGEKKACSRVNQTQCEVWQSTTRCTTSIEIKERNVARINWFYFFQERKKGLT